MPSSSSSALGSQYASHGGVEAKLDIVDQPADVVASEPRRKVEPYSDFRAGELAEVEIDEGPFWGPVDQRSCRRELDTHLPA